MYVEIIFSREAMVLDKDEVKSGGIYSFLSAFSASSSLGAGALSPGWHPSEEDASAICWAPLLKYSY